MDLSELLAPERIHCKCDEVHSKKRALQTLAEMLSQSLQAPEEEPDAAQDAVESGGSIGQLASKLLKNRPKSGEEDKTVLSEMGILDAFIIRERLGSTCLDHGIALPHSRIAHIDQPIAALVTLTNPIDYDNGDKPAVDIVLGLLVPEECNDEHLQILATLARRFSDATFRDTLRSFESSENLYNFLTTLGPVS